MLVVTACYIISDRCGCSTIELHFFFFEHKFCRKALNKLLTTVKTTVS